LLKAGADAMALTDAGTSALHYLVRHSTDEVELFNEVLTLLLNKGADIDSQNKHGESPLIQASFRGKKQSVDFLLEHHAEVNITTKYVLRRLSLSLSLALSLDSHPLTRWFFMLSL
jgi:ankyrin repeat protein